MLRVLRPGGHVVINEMYRDGQSETQATHVLLHHWWAAVGRQRGDVHRETYLRGEIVEIVEGLGLGDLRLADLADPDEDPHDPETVAELRRLSTGFGLARAMPSFSDARELARVFATSVPERHAAGRRHVADRRLGRRR
jgi:hypothetical protein